MSAVARVPLRFQVGARTLFSIPRRLVRVSLDLAQAEAGHVPALPPLALGQDGYLVTSLAEDALERLPAGNLARIVRQRYVRRYAALDRGFDAWAAQLSGKSRSTLLRKERKLAGHEGGTVDLRAFASPDEIAAFFPIARAVSAASYQEKLLDAGLPDDLPAMLRLAAADQVRAFLLFVRGEPAAYLYLPADGRTLIYAYLGFDPRFADWSVGSVLQLGAMRLLAAEGRFDRLDFTEGEGQHKRLFATDGVACCDLLLLRRTPANLAAAGALQGFDRGVAWVKQAATHPRVAALAKRVRR
ncbi:GNAT family N-acetyltransferase [Sphingomonas jatrophae]|uniref:Acetyltransferase (GNAT) domain-containing protein n=1 Tax=Sphingomonas jatrophae TaxID=1166337 RepID=A0A1I6JK11_9SPHN|nr:GNAT family N-acetyltransferase [Sphingomonas jatrophae]SFR79368.1 Acetyltransferase (GNAT) domain-containing protein [Sphingomonas jatrophae]